METVSGVKCELGEGPVWSAKNGLLSWIDILNGHVHEWSPGKKTLNTLKLGQMVGATAFCSDNNYIAALQHGFAFIDRKTGITVPIFDPEGELPNNRFNDGKCDPAGRFWAGTMPLAEDTDSGSLYAMEVDGSVSKKEDRITISNGLAWSLDHTLFYYIDTPTLQVVCYDYDKATGDIANKRAVITIPKTMGFPDGMTIDAEGMLWIAHWGGWQVTRWNPDTGQQLFAFQLPVSNITSCTFGGEFLRDLYITSARKGLSTDELEKQPLAGSLFVIKDCGYQGMPANLFPRS